MLKNAIQIHSPEMIESVFSTCGALHNWLLDYDEWDDWHLRGGVINDDDVVEVYDPLDLGNQQGKNRRCSYTNFGLNFTRAEARRVDPNAFTDDGVNESYYGMAEDRVKHENRKTVLIQHYMTMYRLKTLQLSLK